MFGLLACAPTQDSPTLDSSTRSQDAEASSIAPAVVPATASLAGRYAGKNLLLITVDTLRADRLGAYGYPLATSPNIDKLAGRGFLFETAIAPRGMTWPSLASVHSGLLPRRTGVRTNGQHVPKEIRTLAESLRNAGYTNRAFVSNACAMTRQGFETRECGLTDTEISGKVAAALTEQSSDAPWFIWAHYFATHSPYEPKEDHDLFRQPDYRGPVTGVRDELNALVAERAVLDADDLTELDGYYDGEVRTVDHEVAKVLDALTTNSSSEDTVVVFLADHGEDLYEHNGYFFHACSIYDSSLHVPWILSLPDGEGSGHRVPGVVELVDVLPTLADLLGLETRQSLDGRSLLPRLEGESPSGEPSALSEYYNREIDEAIYTLRTDRWRYVYNPRELTPQCLPKGDFYAVEREELYDLQSDPGERNNVVAEHPEVVGELRRTMREKLKQSPTGAAVAFDESLREELEALGYLN